jgi:hypothetical protein
MLKRLQSRWGVGGWRLLLIIMTFALGGSATGYVGRKLLGLLHIDAAWLFIPLYIIVVTLIWPFMVLLVSIPLGQFPFFKRYIQRLTKRITGR